MMMTVGKRTVADSVGTEKLPTTAPANANVIAALSANVESFEEVDVSGFTVGSFALKSESMP